MYSKLNLSLEIILRIVLIIVYGVLEKWVTPFTRIIPRPAWQRIQYPHKPDTVEIWLLALLCLVIPILALITTHIVHRNYLKKHSLPSVFKKNYQIHPQNNNNLQNDNNSCFKNFGFTRKSFLSADVIDALLAYVLCMALNGVITNQMKLLVGRPRPDFFNRCYVNVDIYNSNDVELKLNSVVNDLQNLNCDGDPHTINEGRKSFPSGHSSSAFAGFGFVAFYVWGKSLAFAKFGYTKSWRFLSGFPFLLTALYIVISRTQDYRHHWEDVTIGSIIGLLSAYFSYRLYYPKLCSDFANLSYRQMKWIEESGDVHNLIQHDNSQKWNQKREGIRKTIKPYYVYGTNMEMRDRGRSATGENNESCENHTENVIIT